MTPWLDLSGKVFVVTGGRSGIGSVVAESLAKNGAAVVVADLGTQASSGPDNVSYLACNVTDRGDVDRLIAAVVAAHGRLDGLVNCAGVNRPRLLVDYYNANPAHEMSEEDFDFQVAVNQKGPFLCAQAAARVMIKQGSGVIVNITSEAGAEGSKGQSVYAATKGALNSFTLSWAKELGQFGIRVVGVAPAINVPTPMGNPKHVAELAYTRGLDPENIATNYSGTIPLGRPGEIQEVADVVTYAVSDRASYVTGTTLAVTGGKSKG